MNDWRKRLTERLRQLKDDGVSQAEIARRMGKSPSALANWTAGLREPETLADFQMLADALNVPLSWLITGDEGMDWTTAALLKEIRGLNQEERESLLKLIQAVTRSRR